jgi:molecular chaperone GrpE (heat shock protein)
MAWRAVRDAQPLIEQQFDSMQSLNGLITTIEEMLSQLWCGRERITGDYYDLLDSLLEALDECGDVNSDDSQLAIVRSRLERALRDQGVEPIAVATGQPFCSATQTSEAVDESAEFSPGTVLRLLETGYQRCLADGNIVLVRPARVVVSGPIHDCQESP